MLQSGEISIVDSGEIEPLPLHDNNWPPVIIPHALSQVMLSGEVNVYAIIDAAKVFGLRERLSTSGLMYQCLYRGSAKEEWGDVAPWLVKLEFDQPFVRKLFVGGNDNASLSYQKGTALFVRTTDDLDEVSAHFRRFTKARGEDGRVFLLRFYDPLTFSDLLKVMPGSQLAKLHGNLNIICLLPDGTWSSTEVSRC